MKTAELRDKSDTELESMLGELRDQIQDMRFKLAAKQMKNMADANKVRRTIATILTLKKERALGLMKKSKPTKEAKPVMESAKKPEKTEGKKEEAKKEPAAGPADQEVKKPTGKAGDNNKTDNKKAKR